jgi:hypothetical protein
MITFVPWSGMLGGAVAMGSPVVLSMGCLLAGLLAATTLALVLGGERKPRRPAPVIALRSASTPDRAAAA